MIGDEEIKGRVVEKVNNNDRIFMVKVIVKDKVLNIVNAYASQEKRKSSVRRL